MEINGYGANYIERYKMTSKLINIINKTNVNN